MKIQLILFFLFISFAKSSAQNIVSFRVKNGLINGKIETSVDGKQLNVFKGIPYAEPPVANLRFMKPLPAKKWSKPLNAFKLSKVCPQDMTLLNMYENPLQMSEDCLYMNIWTPIDKKDTNILKPVMFYIHGGALQVGSASENSYQGGVLASKGDVVVVTINYRLNAFGFLYSGTEDAPGNVAFWDQALALQWVKDNIKSFGGDPDQITIFGISAGSWSVSLHVLSPITRNLFKNAIMTSGAYLFNFVEDSPRDHIKQWLKGAKLIGCKDDQAQDKFTPKIIDCLRKAEPEKIASIESLPQMYNSPIRIFKNVVTDGHFLPKSPNEMLSSKDYNKDINLMFSTTGNEGSVLLALFGDPNKYNPLSPQNMSYSQAFEELSHLSQNIQSKAVKNGEQVSKVYFSGLSNSKDLDLLRQIIGIGVGDYLLSCPSILFAKEFYRNSDFKSNVYQYYYNRRTDLNSALCAKWMGVCHGNDAIPTFGLPFIVPINMTSKRDREVSEQLIQILSQFAKTGSPPPQNGNQWLKYYNIDGNIVTPYYELNTKQKSETIFGEGLKLTECEFLWKKHIIEDKSRLKRRTKSKSKQIQKKIN